MASPGFELREEVAGGWEEQAGLLCICGRGTKQSPAESPRDSLGMTAEAGPASENPATDRMVVTPGSGPEFS